MSGASRRAAESLAALRSALAQHRYPGAAVRWSSSGSPRAPITNAAENLARARIASGFGFWNTTAGFDISQTLIDYSTRIDLWPRLLGRPAQHAAGRRPRHRARDHARLRHRHRAAVEELAGGASWRAGYVEVIRNLPLLLQLLFWYNAVLKALPELPRQRGDSGRRASQQSRPVPAAADLRTGLRGGADRARARALSARLRSDAGRAAGRCATGQQAPVLSASACC